jgi:1-phosphofructokinase family hexose kinase
MSIVLTVTPNPLVDFVAPASLGAPGVQRIERFEVEAGGKGINVGRLLAGHGHRVLAATFQGGWTGALLRDLMRADGLEPLLVPTEARTRLGFQAVAAAGGSAAVLENGFRVTSGEAEALLALVRERLGEVRLVIASGSVPDASCEGIYVELVAACAAAGVPCWVDGHGPAMRRALEGGRAPDLCKPNKEELAEGRGWERAAELHLTDGPGEIRVSLGGARLRVVPPKVHERNAVGSGDAYLGALAHARLSGWPMEEQLRYAAAAGAANAELGALARLGPEEIRPYVAFAAVVREP